MNVRRTISKAAAGSVLLAAATSATAAAQAADLGSTVNGTAVTASSAGRQATTATQGLLMQSGVARKVTAVKKAVQAGTDAVNAGNELVNP
ncbi:MAG: hypothetical protein HOY69_23285 [Streptomyces sp.]|nr:hypothetical protein [Streptomyces sp.]